MKVESLIKYSHYWLAPLSCNFWCFLLCVCSYPNERSILNKHISGDCRADTCTSDGHYSALQCSSKLCYCVSVESGVEVPFTHGARGMFTCSKVNISIWYCRTIFKTHTGAEPLVKLQSKGEYWMRSNSVYFRAVQ